MAKLKTPFEGTLRTFALLRKPPRHVIRKGLRESIIGYYGWSVMLLDASTGIKLVRTEKLIIADGKVRISIDPFVNSESV